MTLVPQSSTYRHCSTLPELYLKLNSMNSVSRPLDTAKYFRIVKAEENIKDIYQLQLFLEGKNKWSHTSIPQKHAQNVRLDIGV